MRRLLSCSLTILLCLGLLSACIQFKSKRGVEVAWQTAVVDKLVRGESTRADVLDALGPPSQVIALEDETVLYYLFEKEKGEGMILIVYNRIEVDTRYDTAIFFFDENDLLTDYSARIHKHDEE
jgi:outer membrane protein assembly factor BamE (lipoprotein component of BamABCDE complex)